MISSSTSRITWVSSGSNAGIATPFGCRPECPTPRSSHAEPIGRTLLADDQDIKDGLFGTPVCYAQLRPPPLLPALIASCRECRHQGSASAAATGARRRGKDRSWGVYRASAVGSEAVRRRWRCRQGAAGRVAQAVRRHGFPRGRMVPALRVEHREWPGSCSDGDESIATVAVRAMTLCLIILRPTRTRS
jgi:hypothetical protein